MESDAGWVSWGKYEFAHAENIEISQPDSFEGFVFSGVINNGRYIICPIKFSLGNIDPRDVNPICAKLGWEPSTVSAIHVGTTLNHDSAYLQIEIPDGQRRFNYRAWPFVSSSPEVVLEQIIGSSGPSEMEIIDFAEIEWDKVQTHVWFA